MDEVGRKGKEPFVLGTGDERFTERTQPWSAKGRDRDTARCVGGSNRREAALLGRCFLPEGMSIQNPVHSVSSWSCVP